MKNRVYVQSEFLSDVKMVEADDSASVETLKQLCIEALPPDARGHEIYLFLEDEDGEQHGHSDRKVEHLKKPHGIRVHLHRCKHIRVTVRFSGQTVTHEFRPSATIGRIRQWAGHKLGMQPNDIAEHVLQLAGSAEQPDVDVHVGVLAKCPACSVEFDLVPAHRING